MVMAVARLNHGPGSPLGAAGAEGLAPTGGWEWTLPFFPLLLSMPTPHRLRNLPEATPYRGKDWTLGYHLHGTVYPTNAHGKHFHHAVLGTHEDGQDSSRSERGVQTGNDSAVLNPLEEDHGQQL